MCYPTPYPRTIFGDRPDGPVYRIPEEHRPSYLAMTDMDPVKYSLLERLIPITSNYLLHLAWPLLPAAWLSASSVGGTGMLTVGVLMVGTLAALAVRHIALYYPESRAGGNLPSETGPALSGERLDAAISAVCEEKGLTQREGVCTAYTLFDILLFIAVADTSRRTGLNPILAFGLCRAVEGAIPLAATGTVFVFALQCERVIETYAPSPREAEVMELIVRGRSVPHIAERLEISRSTVKTHVARIYQKLDVDNRQDMIDLIERVDVEGRRLVHDLDSATFSLTG